MTEPLDDARGASAIRWSRVNDEPFEYAIQQGPHGDEFVKLLDGTCLRRAAPARCDVESAGLRQLFSDHYWDSFEADKEIILKHIDSVLALVPPPSEAGRISDLTKLAAECHRAKWQFDLNEDYQPSKSAARGLITKAFSELHRIGDIAMKMRNEARALSPDPGTVAVASADRCADPKNCPYPVCIADGHCESSPISSTDRETL